MAEEREAAAQTMPTDGEAICLVFNGCSVGRLYSSGPQSPNTPWPHCSIILSYLYPNLQREKSVGSKRLKGEFLFCPLSLSTEECLMLPVWTLLSVCCTICIDARTTYGFLHSCTAFAPSLALQLLDASKREVGWIGKKEKRSLNRRDGWSAIIARGGGRCETAESWPHMKHGRAAAGDDVGACCSS